jgi:hypothetical protein
MAGQIARERINVAATRDYIDWLDGVAERDEATKAVVVDRALREYAEARGHAPPPPRRLSTWRRGKAAGRPQGIS